MKTIIELRSHRPARIVAGWHGLCNLACLLFVLAGGTLSIQAGEITVQTSYCPGDIVRVEGTGWVPGEDVTLYFQPSFEYRNASADGDGNFSIDTLTLAVGDAGTTFTVTASNSSDGENTQSFDVNSPLTLDALSDQVACEGDTVVFTAVANGTGPFTYQWFKNGEPLSGETFDMLFLDGVTPADNGSLFSVAVSGACGTETTSARLFVNGLLSVTGPEDMAKYVGESVAFNTEATGSAPATYLWRKDGMEISGETNSSYSIGAVALTDTAIYTVEATGPGLCNRITNSAMLTVLSCTIECPSGMIVSNDLNACSAIVNYPPPVAPGPCGPATCVPASGSMFPIGQTMVQCSLPGGTACSFTVSVLDKQAPTVHCPADIMTVAGAGVCSAIVDFTVTAEDNCNGLPPSLPGLPAPSALSPVTIVANPASGSEFPIGTTPVMVTATDLAGNVSTCSFNVTVMDDQLPTLACPPGITADPAAGQTTAVVTFNVPAKDNCPGVAVVCTPAAGSTFQQGTTPVNCVATDASGNTNSCSFNVTVSTCVSATPLANVTKCAGESATFSTVASGTEPFTYQWLFNGAPISSADGSAYTVNPVAAESAGTYCVIVSGHCGSVTNCATLIVGTNTTLISLASQTACQGTAVTFSTQPSGTGPFTFVWKKDDVAIDGATANSLVLANITPMDAGTYVVEVSGKCNTVASSATLSVSTNTTATALVHATVCPGATATFSTTASGTGLPTQFIVENDTGPQIVPGELFTFVWRKDGVLLEGQTNASLAISNVTSSEVGAYCVEVSGLCNTVTNCATLEISTGTVVTGLSDQSVCPDSTVTFSALVSGAGPFSYLWKKDGNVLNGEANSSLTLLNVMSGDTAVYSVEVFAACDSATNSAKLTVLEITAVAELTSLTKRTGETAVFSTTPSGTGPFTIVWRHDGTVIQGATGPTLTISPVTLADAGTYTIEVSGACLPPVVLNVPDLAAAPSSGPATSSATLTINCSITATPLTSLGVKAGSNVLFSTVASGSGPFTYVWRHDGNIVSNQTGSTLALNNVGAKAAGTYCVEVTGACAAATNCAALVVRGDNVTVTPLADAEFCEGGNASFSTTATGSPSFTYAWLKNGMLLPSATGSTLPINNAQSSDAGTYCVVVSWMTGSATSCASLTVQSPTTATIPDVSSKDCSLPTLQEQIGAHVSMTIVEGYPDCELRTTLWNVPAGHSVTNGTYLGWCIDYSRLIARDTVYTPAMYFSTGTLPPQLQNDNWSYVNYLLNHKHGTSIDIQNAIWHFIGGPVPSNDSVYYPPSQTALDMIDDALANGGDFMPGPGQIKAVVLDVEDNVQDNIIEVRCPGYVTDCEGEIAVICVTAGGTGPFTYQWSKSGVAIQGENAECLEVDPATSEDSGVYTVTVTGACGSATASAGLVINSSVSVQVLAANLIHHDDQRDCPIEVNLCLGEQGTVYALASGGGPYSYEWLKDGVPMPCRTSDLHFPNVTANNAGSYTAKVTGACGDDTRCFTVSVHQPVHLTPLRDIYACQDGYVSIDAIVTGDGPFTYIWKRNGVVLPAETNSSLVFIQVSSFDAAAFTVEVIGSCNYAISSMNLIIRTRTEIVPLVSQTICEGESAEFDTETAGTGPFQFVWFKDGNLLAGQTSIFLAIPSAKPKDSGLYTLRVIGPCNTITNSAALTVKALVQITALDNQAACLGEAATFTAQVTGAGPLSYVWKKGNQVIAGQNNNTLTLAHCSANDAGLYTVEVTGPCNKVTHGATLAINVPTDITALANKTLCEGAAATFSTSATGTGPHTFVWKKNGSVIAGQNNNSLAIPSVAQSDAGTYTVEVRGLCNTVSSSATLTVNQKTAVAALGSRTSCLGETVVFSAAATGTGPFTYEWKKDGSVLPGQTNSALTLASVAQTNAGTYEIKVTGACGSVKQNATLTVNTPIQAAPLAGQEKCLGERVTFVAGVTGSGPLIYTWMKNGIALPGQTNATYGIPSVTSTDAGSYSVMIAGPCNLTNLNAILAVNQAVTASPLIAQTKCAGESVLLSTTASGTSPITYVWRRNGNLIASQSGSSMTIAALTQADAGLYSVEVRGACNSVTNSAAIAVNTPTTATPLANVTRCQGEIVMFMTTASGTGPFSYIWRKNGAILPGKTASELTINAALPEDAGAYSVEVLGACNSVIQTATLAVKSLTGITPLANQTNCLGATITLATTITGSGPRTIVWQKDGALLAGQTNSTLVLTNVTATNAGAYSVQVVGACNTATSSATLTIETCLIESIKKVGGIVEIRVKGVVGRRYRLECSFDLVHWEPVGTQVNQSGVMTFMDPNNSGLAKKFYRAVLLP